MRIVLALPLALCGCTATLEQIRADHAAWVCRHKDAVETAANLALANSYKINDDNLRAAAEAVARNDLAIVVGCEAGSH